MSKYQIFEVDNNGERSLHHSLSFENAEKLANAYAVENRKTDSYKTYSVAPNNNIDENDVDFSNDIVTDLLKDGVKEDAFLEEFLKRKSRIKQALNNMAKEAMKSKRYTSLTEFLNDNE